MPSKPKKDIMSQVRAARRTMAMNRHVGFLWPVGTIVLILGVVNYFVVSVMFSVDKERNNQDMMSRALLVKQQLDCSGHSDSDSHDENNKDAKAKLEATETAKKKSKESDPTAETEPTGNTTLDPHEGLNPIEDYVEKSQLEGHDKERILALLANNAKIDYLSDEVYEQLPTWTDVTDMYGKEPRLMNDDQCKAFQAGSQEELTKKFLAVAGMFNTGTNLLEDTLRDNCVLHKKQKRFGKKKTGMRAQVPYGKHNPPKDAKFRKTHIILGQRDILKPEHVMPAVMVRDPYRWLQSMCINYYSSRWPRPFRPDDQRYHCPNLVPTQEEVAKLKKKKFKPLKDGDITVYEKDEVNHAEGVFMDKQFKKKGEKVGPPKGTTPPPEVLVDSEPTTFLTQDDLKLHHFPVHVVYANFTRYHYSLIHLFNDWYQEYNQLKDYPHVFLRFEDLIYFPDEVVKHVCECAGGRLKLGGHFPVNVAAESQKQHHRSRVVADDKMQHTGYLDAIIKYGNPATRFRGMTLHDLQYANHYLDKELMQLFGYKFAPLHVSVNAEEK